MGENTRISWADHTFNYVWGCTKVSEGCKNCYAESVDRRFHQGGNWGPNGRRRFFGPKHWNGPRRWNRAAAAAGFRARVFCASMADVFEELPLGHPDRGELALARLELWELIKETPNLDWLLLTKRPENFRHMLPDPVIRIDYMPNVWLGVTAENQAEADRRIPVLLDTHASVRFVSYEPALGPLAVSQWLRTAELPNGIDWLIAGAESGRGARPMDEDWVRDVRDQCAPTAAHFFYKQRIKGGRKVELPELDGRQWAEVPQ